MQAGKALTELSSYSQDLYFQKKSPGCAEMPQSIATQIAHPEGWCSTTSMDNLMASKYV